MLIYISTFKILDRQSTYDDVSNTTCVFNTHVSNNIEDEITSMSTNQGPSTFTSCDEAAPYEAKMNTGDSSFSAKECNFICQPETGHDRTSKMVPSNGNAKKALALSSPSEFTKNKICIQETKETTEKLADHILLPIEEDGYGGNRKMDVNGKTLKF